MCKASKCGSCTNRETCKIGKPLDWDGSVAEDCISSGYTYYDPDTCIAEENEDNVPKQLDEPVHFIQIVVTDEAKKLSGNQSNVYLFVRTNFEVSTINLCGKEFVQVREIKTGKPALILDASTVLSIDYEWQPTTYCV